MNSKKIICSLSLGMFMSQALLTPGVLVSAKELVNQPSVISEEGENNLDYEAREHFLNSSINVEELKGNDKQIYDEVIKKAIDEYKNTPGFDEQEFIEQVNYVLSKDPNSTSTRRKRSIVSIPNSVVATATNVAISLAIGGASGAAIRAYVVKVGAKRASNAIAKSITSRLWAMGIKNVTGISTLTNNIIKNILDPGSAVASWLDSRDSSPNNGRVEIG